jgi:hypothetical protein
MGAINKETLNYEYPKIASKKNKYKCPSCDKDVIFRKGKIKTSHYAHKKSNTPCYYYDRPSESQIHKDAKMLMKTLLDKKTNISFYRKCNDCYENEDENINYILEINEESYNNTYAFIEHKFIYNNSNRSADVALVENNNIKYIFEICYKNKTKEENRPEPWFEIDAENLIKYINTNSKSKIEIECKRQFKCEYCVNRETFQQEMYNKRLEKIQAREKEQSDEANELFNMSKEDERTIQNQYKIELERKKERLEKEILRKQLELEREREIKKKLKEECDEKQRKESEYLNLFGLNNNKCITCNKRKCKCVKITQFFKKLT